MEIRLVGGTIGYFEFLKLFTIGWAVGLGALIVSISLLVALRSLASGDVALAIHLSTMILAAPIALVLQGPLFGSIAYVGIVAFRRGFGLTFVQE